MYQHLWLSCKETSSFLFKLFENAIKNQIVRQDSRHRGPEDGNNAKHVYLKLSQLIYGHVIRMHDGHFYGELQEGKDSQGGQKKRYKDTLKTLRHTNTVSGTG